MISIKEIAEITNGTILSDNDSDLSLKVSSFSTDTRTIKKGDFYIGLKGENFNGEDFIDKALENGAIGYFTTSGKIIKGGIGIKIEDTKTAYLQLANYRKKQINPTVIMITGSSGKTTTKELVYSVISQKFKTVKTFLNHNNEIGFCQTIFSMENDTEVVIIEAGMRGLGEIELISRYAQPDISIISNVGTAHIGRLGSVENIAKAKCEITKFANPDGILIAHNNDLIKNTTDFKGQKLFYSIDDVNITKKEIGFSEFIYKGEEYQLNVDGDYNIENSISAIEAGKYLKISHDLIAKGLSEYKPIEKRWEIEQISGYNVINDSYNANPESMKAALSTIMDLYPDSLIILGDMGELGKDEVYYHKNIADFINSKKQPIKMILTVGELAKNISENITVCKTKHFDTNKAVGSYILDNIKIGTTIFLKASRAMKFEEILSEIKEKAK